jgi:hypothetical protein
MDAGHGKLAEDSQEPDHLPSGIRWEASDALIPTGGIATVPELAFAKQQVAVFAFIAWIKARVRRDETFFRVTGMTRHGPTPGS